MTKQNNNTILWIIGIVILLLVVTNFPVQKETGMIGLTPHYYKDGVEVFPTKGFFGFSIVTPPGGTYDQIAFDISGTGTGVTFSNIQIVDASPLALKNALPTTISSLAIGESKTLWGSDLMETVQFESMGQPVNFWIKVSAVNDYTEEIVYAEGDIGLTIEPEVMGFGDGSDGTIIFTLSTKSFGNIVLDTDYKVNGNILYLKTDKVYNFESFTLGEGTELRPWNYNTKAAVVYIQATEEVRIDGDVLSSFEYAYNPVRGNSVATSFYDGFETIFTPGVANGGVGGAGGGGSFGATGGFGGAGTNGFGGGGGGGGTAVSGTSTYRGNGGSGGSGGLNPTGGNCASIYDTGATWGSPGSQSGGGAGGAALKEYSGGSSANRGGAGSSSRVVGGTPGLTGSNGNDCAGAGGGGGTGGLAGYSGLHFYVKARDIYFTGGIFTKGTSGGHGTGQTPGYAYGRGEEDCSNYEVVAGGGGGGGGGSGGSGGNIKFIYSNLIEDTGSKSMFGGSRGYGNLGGTHISRGDETSSGDTGGTGANGQSGSSGIFNAGLG